MGTNYYLKTITDVCGACGRGNESEELHIGKSSGGWCFALHVIPELEINDLDDWVREWNKPNAQIRNEYGDIIAPNDLYSTITKRKWEHNMRDGLSTDELAAFLARNNAEEGPNNLLRHRIGPYCVGHGSGTWDRMTGEFS